jgi:hypothetical protein
VVLELKRNEDGAFMDLQALRYAAMVSTMTFSRAAEVHQRYLQRIGRGHEVAQQAILEFLGWDAPREEEFAQDVRIVLAAANFSKELTTTVMWLNERQIDVRCVRIQPYLFRGQLLIDVQQIIPLPEAAAYQIQLKEKAAEQRVARMHSEGGGPDFARYDLRIQGQLFAAQWKRNMIYHVVRAALEHGIRRKELPVPEGKWFVVDELCPDAATFGACALKKSPSFKFKRWFAKEHELFREEQQTFAFSNQWSGPVMLPLIDSIAATFPTLQISYTEADGGDGDV